MRAPIMIKGVLGQGRCVKIGAPPVLLFQKERDKTFTDYSQRTIGYKALEITTILCSLVCMINLCKLDNQGTACLQH